jgi:hypothetical protein
MIYLVNGMAEKHAQATEKWIASILTVKWTLQKSQIASFFQTLMYLAIV